MESPPPAQQSRHLPPELPPAKLFCASPRACAPRPHLLAEVTQPEAGVGSCWLRGRCRGGSAAGGARLTALRAVAAAGEEEAAGRGAASEGKVGAGPGGRPREGVRVRRGGSTPEPRLGSRGPGRAWNHRRARIPGHREGQWSCRVRRVNPRPRGALAQR